jgi:hypothetical protein
MNKLIRVSVILFAMLLFIACNFSLNTNATQKAPTASPTALMTIAATETETSTPPTVAFTGLPPGDTPKTTASWLTDAKTPANVKNAYAIAGDDFAHNQFERPFNKDLVYRPDLDIQSATLTLDTQWLYVIIVLDGTDTGKDTLDACYGVELDVNLDGRSESSSSGPGRRSPQPGRVKISPSTVLPKGRSVGHIRCSRTPLGKATPMTRFSSMDKNLRM